MDLLAVLVGIAVSVMGLLLNEISKSAHQKELRRHHQELEKRLAENGNPLSPPCQGVHVRLVDLFFTVFASAVLAVVTVNWFLSNGSPSPLPAELDTTAQLPSFKDNQMLELDGLNQMRLLKNGAGIIKLKGSKTHANWRIVKDSIFCFIDSSINTIEHCQPFQYKPREGWYFPATSRIQTDRVSLKLKSGLWKFVVSPGRL